MSCKKYRRSSPDNFLHNGHTAQNPDSIILVTSTTQVAKRLEFIKRAGISEKTVVFVSEREYKVFTKESAFDCNEVIEVAMSDLIKKIENNGSMNYPKIPDSILAKLIIGVNESPRVSEAFKKML